MSQETEHVLLFILSLILQDARADQMNNAIQMVPSVENHLQNVETLSKLGPLDILGDYITPRGEGVSAQCVTAGEYYKRSLQGQSEWAMKMFDSTPKFPQSGIYEGNLFHFPGVFHECLRAESVPIPNNNATSFYGKYCLMGLYTIDDKELGTLGAPQTRSFGLLPDIAKSGMVKFATCIPSICSDVDGSIGMNTFLEETTPGQGFKIQSHTLGCQAQDKDVPLNTSDWVMITILWVMGVLIFVSTLLDLWQRFVSKNRFPDRFLGLVQGFSAYHNTCKLFNTNTGSDNLGCINGIRFISMTWVVMGHTFQQFLSVPFLNNFLVFISPDGPVGEPYMAAIWNAMDSVDTFFLIGSVLLSYHTLKELDKTSGGSAKMWGMFYVHRYLRLTGVYAVIILWHTTLVKYIATGPQGYILDMYLSESCKSDWWANLLYINNFGHQGCLGQTWYLAVDMQLFILSPIAIYTLWKKPRAGYILCGLGLVYATAYPLIYCWVHDDCGWNGNFDEIYIKPWGRAQPYILGLLVGYYLHWTKNQQKLQHNIFLNSFFWVLAFIVAMLCIFGIAPYHPVSGKFGSLAERVIYNGFNRLAWACAISWVIVACVKKRGGPINEFLSWRAFIPLARISYCMYLIHITVLVWHNSTLTDNITYDTNIFDYTYYGNIVITAGVSVFLVITLEMPILHMEKLLFGLLGLAGLPKPKRYVKKGKEEKIPEN